VLIGHSLGGSLALRYAARNRERVAALALLDVGPRIERAAVKRIDEGIAEDEAAFASVEERIVQLRRRYWLADPARLAEFARLGLRRSEGGGFVPKVDPATRRLLRRSPPGAPPHDEWADLRAIRCPALVVRALGSAVLSRATADRMVNEELADGRLSEVPRSGHALLLDNAPDTVRVLREFLEPLLVSGGSPPTPAGGGSESAAAAASHPSAFRGS
jgi:pimeloyl-ACP methyl ester carboxylesterase